MLTLQVLIDNQIGVLERMATILSRNRINIKHLHIADGSIGSLSLLTFSADMDHSMAEKLRLQFLRIIEVNEVILLFHNKTTAQ